jgi:hypothetical protein
MHIGRVHTQTIPTFRGGPKKRRALQVVDHADHAEVGVATLTRTRTTRQEVTVTEKAEVPVQKFNVNGCPNCFFPVGLMHEDLTARKIAIPPYCPSCTCPIQPVKTALNLVNRKPGIELAMA